MSLLVRALPLVETHHRFRALPLVSLLVRALPLVETINHAKHVGPPAGPQHSLPWPGQPQLLTSPGKMGRQLTNVPQVLDTVSQKLGKQS